MRFIKLLVLASIAIVLIVISMANRDPLTVRLLPDELSRLAGLNFETTLPTYVIILGAMLVGVALGFVWEWVREHKHRATASTEAKARKKLEGQMREVAPTQEAGDDVLAILDGR